MNVHTVKRLNLNSTNNSDRLTARSKRRRRAIFKAALILFSSTGNVQIIEKYEHKKCQLPV
jgi:hypothetical protein